MTKTNKTTTNTRPDRAIDSAAPSLRPGALNIAWATYPGYEDTTPISSLSPGELAAAEALLAAGLRATGARR